MKTYIQNIPVLYNQFYTVQVRLKAQMQIPCYYLLSINLIQLKPRAVIHTIVGCSNKEAEMIRLN